MLGQNYEQKQSSVIEVAAHRFRVFHTRVWYTEKQCSSTLPKRKKRTQSPLVPWGELPWDAGRRSASAPFSSPPSCQGQGRKGSQGSHMGVGSPAPQYEGLSTHTILPGLQSRAESVDCSCQAYLSCCAAQGKEAGIPTPWGYHSAGRHHWSLTAWALVLQTVLCS